MGLGSTAKKLQAVADTAEQLYEQLNELRDRVIGLEETAQTTRDRVETLEEQLNRQDAILEAIAADHDIDIEAVTDEQQTES